MPADNPLRQIYSAIWDMLEAHPGFAASVLASNRIKHTSTTALRHRKDTLSTADVPEVRVIHTASRPHLQRTSNGSSWKVQFEIQIASGDERFAELLDLEFNIYCAMVDWQTYIQNATSWQGEDFVKICRPLSTEASLTNQALNRGIVGWSAVWVAEMELWFATSDLSSYAGT